MNGTTARCVGIANLLILAMAVTGCFHRAADRIATTPMEKTSPTIQAITGPAGAFLNAYRRVDYAKYPSVTDAGVWKAIGGTLGTYGERHKYLNCAARLSYALNRSGTVIPHIPGVASRNSDGYRYILSGRQMRLFLHRRWGKPDIAGLPVYGCSPGSYDFLKRLGLDKTGVAVFASDHHVGIITQGYSDPCLPGQGIADIWILSRSSASRPVF